MATPVVFFREAEDRLARRPTEMDFLSCSVADGIDNLRLELLQSLRMKIQSTIDVFGSLPYPRGGKLKELQGGGALTDG